MERHKDKQGDNDEITKFVMLSEKCNDQVYKACIKALADDCNLPVIMIENGKVLGQWA